MNESIGRFAHELPQYWPILLSIGGLILFFGYYLVKASLATIAFVGGLYIGQRVWEFLSLHGELLSSVKNNLQTAHAVVIFLTAIVVMAVVIAFYKFAVFLAGFLAGGITFSYFYAWIIKMFNVQITIANNPKLVNLAVFIVFGTITGLVTLKSERKAVGTVVGILGALMVSYALMVPLSSVWKIDKNRIFDVLLSGQNMQFLTAFITVFLVLSIFSVWFNSRRKGNA